MLIKRFVVFFILILLSTGYLFAESGEGVLYFAEGGTGGGVFNIFSNGKTLKLIYKNPDTLIKGVDGLFKYGEHCNFKYHKVKSDFVLDSISFTGRFDREVQIANDLIRTHYRLLSQKNFEHAYNDLSPEWWKEQSLESFTKGFKGVVFCENAENAPVFATKIVGHNSDLVIVLVEENWFVMDSKKYLKYEIVRVQDENESCWYINRVKLEKFKEWENS